MSCTHTHTFFIYRINYFLIFISRGDNKKLKNQNDQLNIRLERCLKRLHELEEQHLQQGALQDKMRQRLKQMDEHSGKCTQQVGNNCKTVREFCLYPCFGQSLDYLEL